jgi:hypothetical protein
MSLTCLFYFVETYNVSMHAKHEEDPLTHPKYDSELWLKARATSGSDRN